jgi:hypothetical protein
MDLFEVADKILDRIDAAEVTLGRQIARVDENTRALLEEQLEIRQLIIRNHEQLLRLLAEHEKLDFTTIHNRYLGRQVSLHRYIDPEMEPLLAREFDDYLSDFYSFAVVRAASEIMAGGSKRFADAYSPNLAPRLDIRHSRLLIEIVDSPRSSWASINDYAKLAASVGVPLPWRGALVNPNMWLLGASDFVWLAEGSPELFRSRPLSAKRMAEVYLQGELLRDFLLGLTRRADGGTERAVFDRLLQMQQAAIDQFESTLIARGDALARNLSIDYWSRDPLAPRDGLIRLEQLPAERELVMAGNKRGYDQPFQHGSSASRMRR